MAYSMTGFGRSEKIFGTRRYSIEMKSVNSRYCDINIRCPKIFNFADSAMRKEISGKLIRGKVDVFVTFEDTSGDMASVKVDEALAKAYSDAIKTIAECTGRADDAGAARISYFQDVVSVEQEQADEETMGTELMETLSDACDMMLKMRLREGEALKTDILSKVDELATIRDEVAAHAPSVVDSYRERLAARVDELLSDEAREFYDEGRLAAEVAIFADKCAIDEELTRLQSHLSQAHKILEGEGAVGKQMDFLIQEINREVNTTGSKANDIEITNNVLRMKNLVEEMREQVQNLV